MSALTEFLSARIAEDEAVARDAGGKNWTHWPEAGWVEVIEKEIDPRVGGYGRVITGFVQPQQGWSGDIYALGVDEHYAEHIVRHAPARVLAECESKRRIVARHRPTGGIGCECSEVWPCANLLDLASVYAEHPDYRPRWRP